MIALHNCSAQHLLDPASGLVADESVDLVLTDPPYIIAQETGFSKGGNSGKFGTVDYDFGAWDRGKDGAFTMGDLADVVQALPRVMKPGASAVIWFDIWKSSDLARLMLAAGFKKVTMIDWLKTNAVPINSRKTYLSNAREIAVVGMKPGAKPTFNRDAVSANAAAGLFKHPIENRKGRFHPTEKSMAVFDELIRLQTNAGDLVLDCFSGSGTTAAVCQATGRHFVGCELDEGYYGKTLERLAGPTAAPAKRKRSRA